MFDTGDSLDCTALWCSAWAALEASANSASGLLIGSRLSLMSSVDIGDGRIAIEEEYITDSISDGSSIGVISTFSSASRLW